MGNNSEVLTRKARQCEDTSYGGQFLTRETAHDAGLAEQSLYCRVTAGNSSRMTAGSTTTCL